MLNIFLCACWPFVYLCWRTVYSNIVLKLVYLSLLLHFKSSYIFGIQTTYQIYYLQIFSPIVFIFITFLIVQLATQKFLILMKSNVITFLSLKDFAFDITYKNICLSKTLKMFLKCFILKYLLFFSYF